MSGVKKEKSVWVKNGADAIHVKELSDINWRSWDRQLQAFIRKHSDPTVFTEEGQSDERHFVVHRFIEETCGSGNTGRVERAANAYEAYQI